MKETILVTGGAGYIGSQTCKALAAAGYIPVVYDNFTTGNEWAVRWGPHVRGDIRDKAALSAAIETHRPAAVCHFAALISVPESFEQPANYFSVNVDGTRCIGEAAARARIPVVFSSTAAVYDAATKGALTEAAPLKPETPYGQNKYEGERLLGELADAHDFGVALLRYFNAAGADPDGEIGKGDGPDTHIIPAVLDVAAGRRAAFQVFGNDYDTPDGTCVRDYIHVADLADAHVKAIEYLRNGGGNDAFNLGTGNGHSVRDIVAAARGVTGCDIPEVMGPRRIGDPGSLVAAANRAREILGWRPVHSTLDRMIGDAWAWDRRFHAEGPPAVI